MGILPIRSGGRLGPSARRVPLVFALAAAALVACPASARHLGMAPAQEPAATPRREITPRLFRNATLLRYTRRTATSWRSHPWCGSSTEASRGGRPCWVIGSPGPAGRGGIGR